MMCGIRETTMLCLFSTFSAFTLDVELGKLQQQLQELSSRIKDTGKDVTSALHKLIADMRAFRADRLTNVWYSSSKTKQQLLATVMVKDSKDFGWDPSSIPEEFEKAQTKGFADFDTRSRELWKDFEEELNKTWEIVAPKKAAGKILEEAIKELKNLQIYPTPGMNAQSIINKAFSTDNPFGEGIDIYKEWLHRSDRRDSFKDFDKESQDLWRTFDKEFKEAIYKATTAK